MAEPEEKKKTADEQTSHLAQLIADKLGKEVRIFDEDEAAALAVLAEMQMRSPGAIKAWVSFWEMLQTMGKLGTSIQGVVKWFVYIGGIWITFKAGLIQWVLAVVRGDIQ